MERTFQKSVNRVTRASLGVLSSTQVAFLQAEGGSLTAPARLERRQTAIAVRLASATDGPQTRVIQATTGLGKRLRESLGPAASARVERSVISQGRVFPGLVEVPPVCKTEDRDSMTKAAILGARRQERDPGTVWTDDSRMESGGVGVGMAWYEEVADGEPPVSVSRRGVVKAGERWEREGGTYHNKHRPFRGACSGWRTAGFGMRVGHEAYDADLAAVVYGLILHLGRRETGTSYTIFTDSTAAMTRAVSDAPGPGQEAAV